METFNEVKVFSATLARERANLGERITDWLKANDRRLEVVDKEVRQSSDYEFHCLSIILFLRRKQ
jgi:hypothetical protein